MSGMESNAEKTRRATWLLLGLVVPWLAAPVSAQEGRAPATARHTLWKVQGESNAVYLAGSVHVLRKENYPLAAPIEAAFSNSAIAVFETDIDALEDPETAQKIRGKGRLPDGETLRQQLSPEVYAAFAEHVKNAGLPERMFDPLSPSMAILSLAVIDLEKLGFDPEYGMDKYFFRRARKDAKQIVALETVEFQIGLATDFTREEGEMLMKTTLRDIDKLKQEFGDVLKAWETGNADELEKLLNEATQEAPVIFKRFVADRNRRWLPKIQELARGKENAIVIVGAAHLVGKEGVVELLKKRGLKVTQE